MHVKKLLGSRDCIKLIAFFQKKKKTVKKIRKGISYLCLNHFMNHKYCEGAVYKSSSYV